MGKFNYGRSIKNSEGEQEVFAIEGADSFDEAQKMVEKGIRDRRIQLGEDSLRKVAEKQAEKQAEHEKEKRPQMSTTAKPVSQTPGYNGGNAGPESTAGSNTPPDVSNPVAGTQG